MMPPNKRHAMARKALYPLSDVTRSGFHKRPFRRHCARGDATVSGSEEGSGSTATAIDTVSVYCEVRGNPAGLPVVLFHGGPGYYTTAEDTQLFDPAVYQIISFDQRGSGKSLPAAHSCPFDYYRDITIEELVADAESLRQALLGESAVWCVAGWSWGSAVALLYAMTHPHRTLDVVLQGVYTGSPLEHAPLFQLGRHHREAFGILRFAVALAIRGAQATFDSPTAAVLPDEEKALDALICGDPLRLHTIVRDYIVSFSALQHEHRHNVDTQAIVGPTRNEETGHSYFRPPDAPCRCGDLRPVRPCCIERAHRVLAVWSQFENYMTYPSDRPYFLEKMKHAADLEAPYRASNKDITGALMQLFLFPRMMARGGDGNERTGGATDPSLLLPARGGDEDRPVVQPLLAPTGLRRIGWNTQTRLWIVHGKDDAVCPPAVAESLADAVRMAATTNAVAFAALGGASHGGGGGSSQKKQRGGGKQRGTRSSSSACVSLTLVQDAAHDALDGSAMQTALLTAADEMARHALERWVEF